MLFRSTISPQNYILHSAVACLLTVVLSGCGQGDKNSSTEPSPVAGADSTTLQGTKLSANGVRVEVEDAVTRSFGENAALTTATIKLGRFYQTWFSKQSASPVEAKALVLDEIRLYQCIKQAAPSETLARTAADEVRLRTFNTKARSEARASLLARAGAFILPSEDLECTP